MRHALHRNLKAALGASLIVTLAACWGSETSLFLPKDSVTPLPGGTYEYHVHGEEEIVEVTLIPFPGGGYIYTTETEDDDDLNSLPLLVYRIDADWHVLQMGGDFGTMIGITRKAGDRIEVFNPECEPDLESIEGAHFAESKYGNDCTFDNLAALLEAAQQIIPRIEAGEHKPPIGWFRPEPIEPLK